MTIPGAHALACDAAVRAVLKECDDLVETGKVAVVAALPRDVLARAPVRGSIELGTEKVRERNGFLVVDLRIPRALVQGLVDDGVDAATRGTVVVDASQVEVDDVVVSVARVHDHVDVVENAGGKHQAADPVE